MMSNSKGIVRDKRIKARARQRQRFDSANAFHKRGMYGTGAMGILSGVLRVVGGYLEGVKAETMNDYTHPALTDYEINLTKSIASLHREYVLLPDHSVYFDEYERIIKDQARLITMSMAGFGPSQHEAWGFMLETWEDMDE